VCPCCGRCSMIGRSEAATTGASVVSGQQCDELEQEQSVNDGWHECAVSREWLLGENEQDDSAAGVRQLPHNCDDVRRWCILT
jgi:hypothetical protein